MAFLLRDSRDGAQGSQEHDTCLLCASVCFSRPYSSQCPRRDVRAAHGEWMFKAREEAGMIIETSWDPRALAHQEPSVLRAFARASCRCARWASTSDALEVVQHGLASFGILYARTIAHETCASDRRNISERRASRIPRGARAARPQRAHLPVLQDAGLSRPMCAPFKLTPAWWARALHYYQTAWQEPIGVRARDAEQQEGSNPRSTRKCVLPAFARHTAFRRAARDRVLHRARRGGHQPASAGELCAKYLDSDAARAARSVAEQACMLLGLDHRFSTAGVPGREGDPPSGVDEPGEEMPVTPSSALLLASPCHAGDRLAAPRGASGGSIKGTVVLKGRRRSCGSLP